MPPVITDESLTDDSLHEIQVVTQINHTVLEKHTVVSPKARKPAPKLEVEELEALDDQGGDDRGGDDQGLGLGYQGEDQGEDQEEEISAPDSMFYRQMLSEHAMENQKSELLDILEKGKSIPKIYDHVDESSYSVLHHAAFRGHLEICKILVGVGANIYATDKFGKTPVHFAIQKGFEELAHYLLSNSHPLDFPKVAKMSLIQMAATNGRPSVIKLLAHRGCNVNDRNEIGETPLHMATKNNKLEAMDVLLKLGANVHAQIDEVGHTSMHYACMYGYKEATLKLLYAGGDAHVQNTTVLKRTPLETAKDSGYRPLFNALLDAETKLREENEYKEEVSEMNKTKKHELLLEKIEALNKTNAMTKKTLKERRSEEDLMRQDHAIRMVKERKNAENRRLSKRRVTESSRKSQRSLRGGGSRGSVGSGGGYESGESTPMSKPGTPVSKPGTPMSKPGTPMSLSRGQSREGRASVGEKKRNAVSFGGGGVDTEVSLMSALEFDGAEGGEEKWFGEDGKEEEKETGRRLNFF